MIEAEICEVHIQGIVKEYRHDQKRYWEYSIQRFDRELCFASGFESDEEARKEALEKFKDAIRNVLETLNADLD